MRGAELFPFVFKLLDKVVYEPEAVIPDFEEGAMMAQVLKRAVVIHRRRRP